MSNRIDLQQFSIVETANGIRVVKNFGKFGNVESAVPENLNDLATKAYVDALTSGTPIDLVAKAATDENVDVAAHLEAGDDFFGVVLDIGDNVLLFGQTDDTQNGLYVIEETGTPVRLDAQEILADTVVFVESGNFGETFWKFDGPFTGVDNHPDYGTDSITLSSVVVVPGSAFGGSGGGVASVNGDMGPNVILDAGDVGAFSASAGAQAQIDISDLQTDVSTLQTDVAGKQDASSILTNIAGLAPTNLNILRANGTDWDSVDAKTQQVLYVSKDGNDTNADGSIISPFLTINAALQSISDNSTSKRYVIFVQAGQYDETVLALKPFVYITGYGYGQTRITVASNQVTLAAGWGTSARTMLKDLHIAGSTGLQLDFTAFANASAVIDLQNIWVNGPINFIGRASGSDFLQMHTCLPFGATTITNGQGFSLACLWLNTFSLVNNAAGTRAWDSYAGEFGSNVTITSVGSNPMTLNNNGTKISGTVTVNGSVATLNTDVSVYKTPILTNGGTVTRSSTAAGLAVVATPVNYTATAPQVEAHLAGIDTRIGTISDSSQVLYVRSGAPTGGTGTITKPFTTIQAAIDAYLGSSGIVIKIGAGEYTENLNINKNGVILIGVGPTDSQLVKINGQHTVQSGITRFRARDISFAGVTGGSPVITFNNTAGRHYFDNCSFTHAAGASETVLLWTGTCERWHDFTFCWLGGQVNMDGTPASSCQARFRNCDGDNTVFNITHNNWTARIYDSVRLKSINHANGELIVDGINEFISPASNQAIVSTATNTGKNKILLSAVNFRAFAGTFYIINKSGDCGYLLKDCIRDTANDVLTGSRLSMGEEAGDLHHGIRVDTGSSVSVTSADYIVVCSNTGVRTVNLPPGLDGKKVIIKDGAYNANTNAVDINANGSDTIDGLASYQINTDGGLMTAIFKTGNWYIL